MGTFGTAKPQLVYKFINQTVQPGPAVSLKCIATGNPTPHITWRLDGFQLPQSDRFVIGQYVTLHGDVISHVNISNVAVEDGGIYSCTASNRVGEVTHSADMRVYGLPFVRPMPNISAVAGEPLYIACPVSGYPIESITWEKDRRRLPVTRRQKVFSNGTLLLENVQKDTDRGLYRCTAMNKQGHSSSQTLPLTVTVPPKIAPFSFQTDLHIGERTGVQCVINKGDPPLTIKWMKDGGGLASDVGVRELGGHISALSIESLKPDHAGTYTCVASNAAATASHSAQLLVNVPPRWIQEPVDRNVTRDETVMFDCQAEGFPVPTVVWRKAIGRQPTEYQDLSARNHGVQIFSNGSLLIQHALSEHAGQYMCEATNGIGAGLSAVVVLTVHIPPQFEVRSAQASIRKGASQILQCEARGDTPMTIEWLREGIRLPAHLNPRYEVKESVVKGGFLSELHISSTDKGDSGIFICIAQNKYGRAERTVHLQVQDAPGKPQDVRVVDTTSRSVKIAWLAPSDDRSPVLKYIAQYKPNTSPGDNWHSVAAGSELTAEVSGLLPATLYQFRVVAENDLGLGEHSEPVLLQTDGEAPAGEPQGLSVTAVASDQLRVAWSPPLQHMWNGNILGYYIGYREHSSSRQTSYTYTTVSEKGSGPYSTVLSGLKKYRKYGVVVQAFNEKGPGPMSPEIIAQTLEDVPSAAPLDIKCAAKGPQVIFLTWQPPPLFSQNGLIQGYKVYYENMNEWPPGQIEAETVVTNELATELHGLQKFANYSLQIWAYTRAGDGVKSSSIYCRTEEDVPGSPANIKVLSSSPTSLVVSWMKPVHPNGHLVSYTLYSRILEGGREKDSSKRRLSPAHTHYELHDLRKEEEYEFWVTAFTKVGEGQSTRVVYATISSRVPAAIVSFGDTVSVRRRGSVQLPCVAVGIPSPERSWTAHENPVMGNAFSIQHDGTLHISDVQKHHEENYTCTVSNSEGEDHISYFLQVLVAPSAPLLQVSGTSTSWIQLKWNPVKNGGSAVRGYLLNFRKEGGGEWEERLLPRDATLYQLQGLTCGTEYHLQLFAFNSIGSGAPSELLVVRTNGSRPVKPNFSEFISVNITTVILNFKSWRDNGCPIISFGVEYRESSQQDWITAGNNLAVREHFPVMGLWPGTTYIFRITSTNSAGTTSGEYRIVTQSAVSGNLVPDQSNIHVNDAVPFYMDVAVILPVLISIITLIAVFVGVCIFFHRKPGAQAEGQSQPMVTLDNKHNIAQREQYYAAVQKGATSHSSERIPEFAEDISPYATFHVPNQPSSPAHIQTFVYHDHHLAAMETMKLKSSNPQDDYTKLRGSQKSKCARSESSDYSSSTAHRSDAGPVAIPIHTSTRNDIDGLSLQTILYQGGGIGPESSTSPEPSPLPDRRNVTRRQRHNVSLRSRRTRAKSVHRRSEGSRESHVDPPTSFSDGHELSEAECDMDTIRHYKWAYKGSSSRDNSQHGQSYNNFTIAV
ncbi:Down syndrome cell adhesion molecule-like protein Dscam2 [Schistocerca piceifrons]|uniref:Down syndrome cell adhesion molecule-like protein Dscam2 n=1 Tax=Schistocerca piceifrons TaxID=274613 RepID=UPI001F5E92BE|nr:Down syndrome cell adhesion molecule-like protein Dscam2 [Schistocerca piceifrons]